MGPRNDDDRELMTKALVNAAFAKVGVMQTAA